jgi:hypothetical protein
MSKLLKPKFTFSSTTTQGEITVNINLNLTLSIDESGNINISSSPLSTKFVIPEFESDDKIIENFGEDV